VTNGVTCHLKYLVSTRRTRVHAQASFEALDALHWYCFVEFLAVKFLSLLILRFGMTLRQCCPCTWGALFVPWLVWVRREGGREGGRDTGRDRREAEGGTETEETEGETARQTERQKRD